MTSIITDPKKVNEKHLQFGKIQPRGTFYFVPTSYGGKPLTLKTPSLITPTGIQLEGARSFLDLELDVASNPDHQDLYDMFKAIDDRCIDESIDNMSKWFKGDVDEQFIEDQFRSPITPGWGNEPSEMRVELVSESPEDIMDDQGNVLSSSDVTSLSSVQVTLQLLGVWVGKDFMGCHWRAVSLIANLDHQRKGRRRASSPRRPASPLPPVVARSRLAKQQQDQAKAPPAKATQKTTTNQNDEDEEARLDARRQRIEKMLSRFKGPEDKAGGAAATPEPEKQRAHSDEGYSDDERRYSTRSRYSDDDDYSDDYSDDERRRRRRSYSDEEDDRRRSRGSRDSRYSDDEDYYY